MQRIRIPPYPGLIQPRTGVHRVWWEMRGPGRCQHLCRNHKWVRWQWCLGCIRPLLSNPAGKICLLLPNPSQVTVVED